jgi:hypothetical protein
MENGATMSERDRTYLEYGLYVRHDGRRVELYATTGDAVYLDPQALQNFLRWLDMTRNQRS